MGKQELGVKTDYTPIPPAVEPGQESDAFHERKTRNFIRGVEHAVGAFYYEVWKYQAETRTGRGLRNDDERKSTALVRKR